MVRSFENYISVLFVGQGQLTQPQEGASSCCNENSYRIKLRSQAKLDFPTVVPYRERDNRRHSA
jgi:hypothetical protein